MIQYCFQNSTKKKENTAGDYEHQFLDQMEVNISVRYKQGFFFFLNASFSHIHLKEILLQQICALLHECLNDTTSHKFSEGFSHKRNILKVELSNKHFLLKYRHIICIKA